MPGNIQRLKHCPTYDGPAGMLDFMRPIESSLLANDPGLTLSINQAEVTRMNRDDIRGSTNTIKALTMIDLKGETRRGITSALPCGFLGGSWTVVPGYHYMVTVPKTMGGAYWKLLKDLTNNRRYIKSIIPAAWEYVVFQQSVYTDKDGEIIATPSNKTEANAYELVKSGKLSDMVDALGIFRGPNLKPSRTRMYNADKALDMAVQTDYQEKTYTLFYWADHTWSTYDLNDDESKAEFDAAPEYLGGDTFKIYNRRWVDSDFELVEPKRISSIIHPSQQIVVAKAPGMKWKGEVGAASGRTRLDLYRREDGQVPFKTTSIKRLLNPQVLSLATGNSLVIGSTSNDGVDAIEYSFDGKTVVDDTFPTLDSRICPTACVGDEKMTHVMVFNPENRKYQYYKLYRDTANKWKWDYIADIANGSSTPGSLLQLNDGVLVSIFLGKMFISSDGGHTWTDSAITLPGTCISATTNPASGEILLLSRVKNWDDKQFYMQLSRIVEDSGTLKFDDDYKSFVAVADRVPGQILITNDSEVLVLVAKDNNITVYVSTDGHTWEEQ